MTGCMAHARRRFDEALTVLKKDFTKEQLKETTAYQAMERIKNGTKSVKSRRNRF